MFLTELLDRVGNSAGRDPETDLEIRGLSGDSRAVAPGFLFAALLGSRYDGRSFAAEAVERGAVAILTDDTAALGLPDAMRARVAIVTDANPRRRLAQLAARFYGRQPQTIAAVTGTNGKTSIVDFTRQIWTALGDKAASLGTLGLIGPAGRRPGALTTADPVALHRDLAALAAQGIEHVALEASSHGLAQYRLDGVAPRAAAFTNLTRDHLDYHGDMAAYRAAKERLFDALLAPGGNAVLNADSGEYPRLAALCLARRHPIIAYGRAAKADLRLIGCKPRPAGQRLLCEIFGARREVLLPVAGDFQAINALAALGLVLASGGSEAAADALAGLSAVPGRMQFVTPGMRGAVVVDYAHTPDALATVLKALRPHAKRRLVVLFGCGGDRDPGKRPLMGAAATRWADRVYVTDDNPRSEPPAAIRRAILEAAPGAIEIGGRREAIAAAIAGLGPGDVLLLAGKGHETGQIVGDVILPFDDVEIAREIAGQRGLWRAA